MAQVSKKRKEALAKHDLTQMRSLVEAAIVVKDITYTKFDASVDIDVRLGVDPRKADQMVRGVATLPHGTGKTVRVLALVTPDKEAEALAAGADFVFHQPVAGGIGLQPGLAARDFDVALEGDLAVGTAADLLGTHGYGKVLFVDVGGRRRNLRMQRPRGHGDEGGQGKCPPPRDW